MGITPRYATTDFDIQLRAPEYEEPTNKKTEDLDESKKQSAEAEANWTKLKKCEGQGSQIEIQVKYYDWDPEAKRKAIYWWPIPVEASNDFIHNINKMKKFSTF